MVKQFVIEMVDTVRYLKSKGHNNIKKTIVKGYTEDPENSKNIINLLGDSFNEFFEIESKVLLDNLQVQERKNEIESLYKQLLSEFEKIIKS